MSTEPVDPASLAAARDGRRWLIGISISVIFGLFGVAMALVGYLERTKSTAPAGASAPSKYRQEAESAKADRRPRDRRR